MDDTPQAFVQELKSTVLKKRIGQIALAVVLAEATIRLLNSLVWYLIIPVIGRMLQGQTESVLFNAQTNNPIPWESLFGSWLEFGFAVIVVFYVNRWISRKDKATAADHALTAAESDTSSVETSRFSPRTSLRLQIESPCRHRGFEILIAL